MEIIIFLFNYFIYFGIFILVYFTFLTIKYKSYIGENYKKLLIVLGFLFFDIIIAFFLQHYINELIYIKLLFHYLNFILIFFIIYWFRKYVNNIIMVLFSVSLTLLIITRIYSLYSLDVNFIFVIRLILWFFTAQLFVFLVVEVLIGQVKNKNYVENRKKLLKVNKIKFKYVSYLFVLIILILFVFTFISIYDKKYQIENGPNIKTDELNILNWEDYLGGPEVITNFEKQFNVTVNLTIFQEEYEIYGYNLSNFDLVVVSGRILEKLYYDNKLEKIRFNKIQNSVYLSDKCKFDENYLDYGFPYTWGTTGILVNTDFVKDYDKSWDLFWDSKYYRKGALLPDPDEIFAAISRDVGIGLLPSNLEEYYKVKDFLELIDKNIYGYYDQIEAVELMKNETIWIYQTYNDYRLYFNETNFEFFIPDEGSLMWIDSFVMPKNLKNKHNAELFLDYINDGKVNANISSYGQIASCNDKSFEYLDEEFLNNKDIFPDEKTLSKLDILSKYPINMRIEELKIELFEKLNE